MSLLRLSGTLGLAFLFAGAALGSGSLPRGVPASGGTYGGQAAGCPAMALKGTIAGVNTEQSRILLATDKHGDVEIPLSTETEYRIKGYKSKELEDDPLSKVETGAPAKVTYCQDGNTVKILELKVKKKKS